MKFAPLLLFRNLGRVDNSLRRTAPTCRVTMPIFFKSSRHIWYQNRVVDMEDHLPKFKEAPIEQGGTGELIPQKMKL